MQLKITIEQHRRIPNVSLDAHVRQKQITLGEALSSRTAIYLDVKYWIILRDVDGGLAKSQAACELLHQLRANVVNGKIFVL